MKSIYIYSCLLANSSLAYICFVLQAFSGVLHVVSHQGKANISCWWSDPTSQILAACLTTMSFFFFLLFLHVLNTKKNVPWGVEDL